MEIEPDGRGLFIGRLDRLRDGGPLPRETDFLVKIGQVKGVHELCKVARIIQREAAEEYRAVCGRQYMCLIDSSTGETNGLLGAC